MAIPGCGDTRHNSEAVMVKSDLAVQALSNGQNPIHLASMLDLRDVSRISVCRAMRTAFGRRARKACLTKGAGVPAERRIEFWQSMLNVTKVIHRSAAGVQSPLPTALCR